jgi:hypothetical protein
MKPRGLSRISHGNWFGNADTVVGGGATAETVNDVNVLNLALKLANLEYAFFQKGLAMLNESDFLSSSAVQTIGGRKVGANLFSYINGMARNAQAHVATLIQTVAILDGPPQAPDCYSFGITNADSFLQLAQTISNIVVAAYNGAIIPQWQTSNATVTSPGLQSLLATIATVEARNAAYFSLLNSAIPFAAAFDAAQTMGQTLTAIAPFLTPKCSGPPVPLTLAVAGPAKDSTITAHQDKVPLDASLSSSATGTPLTYLWQQNLGSPLIDIVNPTSVVAMGILRAGTGTYTVSLKVTDSVGGGDQDTLKIIYAP